MTNYTLIQDLQFGSTGKGQIAGTLAHTGGYDAVVTAWGPNAGHTFRKGREKYVSIMLATAAIAPDVKKIFIGPGSVIDWTQLEAEIEERRHLLQGKSIYIHPAAAYLLPAHAEAERKTLLRIGSTMKGTGEALISKIRRQEGSTISHWWPNIAERLELPDDLHIFCDERLYDDALDSCDEVLVEGAQGFSLGVHQSRFFPHTTSRDVSTMQLLADCRIPYDHNASYDVVGVVRSHPIRVANRYDNTGRMVGTSGGCYDDQSEIRWEDIGREPELTTVTKLPRRLFTFSAEQIKQAVRIMGVTQIAMTFCDYLLPMGLEAAEEGDGAIGEMVGPVLDRLRLIEDAAGGVKVWYASYGPKMKDVYSIRRMREGMFLHRVVE